MAAEEFKQRLMYYLAQNFLDVGLVTSTNDFSQIYLGKSKSYYGQQKRQNLDLSIDASVNFLIFVRKHLKKYKETNNTFGGIHDDKIYVLEEAEVKLKEYLRTKFRVAEIVEEVETIYDDNDFYGIII
jgi:hypothetical protein